MKYLSTLFLLGAMVWTWGLAKGDPHLSQQVHVGIQEDLKKLIADYIQQNLPNSTNLHFERFYTEANTENQVKAIFTYSFEDTSESIGNTRVSIDGQALLNRAGETSDTIEWSLDKLDILSNAVDYKEGMKVSPASTNEDTTTPAPQTPEAHEGSH